MEKQRGMAFGFQNTVTAVKKTGQIDYYYFFIMTSLDACKLDCIHHKFVSLCHHHFLSHVDVVIDGNVLNYFKLHLLSARMHYLGVLF
jgi:hypothetical protein